MFRFKKKRLFGFSWIVGSLGFLAVVGWMFFDIMSREGIFRQDNNFLVIGTNAGFKPFEYIENGKIIGFDIDISKEIAKSLGKELKVSDMSFDGLLPALESGQVDMVVAGMSVTPEREKNALFSSSYYLASQRIIVKKGSKIRNKYQLSGSKIGVQLGTTGDNLASKLENVKISQFPNVPSVLQELSAGGVDAVILDNSPATQYVKNFNNLEILSSPLSEENYAIAIKKDNLKLLEKVNQTIFEMKKDGRYKKLIEKYFGENEAKSLILEEKL